MTAPFADHFSSQARLYAQARPRYPDDLFDWVASACHGHELAWEAGCGNGQASAGLAARFQRVVATDPSSAQIDAAERIDGVEYRIEAAESPSLPPASADLVLAAQAYHWFDPPRFHAAVRRTVRPAGLVVLVSYGLMRIGAEIDAHIDHLYQHTLIGDWPAQRIHVDDGYRRLPFPYERIETPAFAMQHAWSLPETIAYLRTWSAVHRFERRTGLDPIEQITPALGEAWACASQRMVRWPLTVLAGRTRTGMQSR